MDRFFLRSLASLTLFALPFTSAMGIVVGMPPNPGAEPPFPGTDQTPYQTPPITTPVFPWDNMVNYHTASAIVLGDIAGDGSYWVISAQHNGTAPTEINIGGTFYSIITESRQQLSNPTGISGTPDLLMFRIDAISLPANIITFEIAASLPSETTPLYMLGRGGGAKRWGLNYADVTLDLAGNRTFDFSGSGFTTRSFIVDMDLSSDTAPLEGRGVSGDSGGGIMFTDGFDWYLAGIMLAAGTLEEDPNIYITVSADLTAYYEQIMAIAIPEPSSYALIGLAGGALLLWNRRKQTA